MEKETNLNRHMGKTQQGLWGQGILLETATQLLCTTDRHGNIVYVNEVLTQVLGYETEELIGHGIRDLLHEGTSTLPGYSHELNANRDRPQREGSLSLKVSWDHEDRYEVDGTVKVMTTKMDGVVNVLALFDKSGRFIGLLRIFHDFSFRLNSNKTLQETDERFRVLFESASDAILIIDMQSNIIIDVNEKAVKLTGHSRESIIGMHQLTLFSPDQFDCKNKLRHTIQNGRISELETAVIAKSGNMVPVLMKQRIITQNGKKSIQTLFKDITLEKKVSDLKNQIGTRKLVDKAKRILVDHHNINEKEAMRRLQKESRRQRRKIKEIAQAIIYSKSFA